MQGIKPMGLCEPWDNYKNKTLFPNMKIKQTTLRCNKKYLQSINPTDLFPFDPTLTYKTAKLKNLRNCVESNTFIYCDRCNHKHRHLLLNLPQACRGRKYVCPVWIRPTENLQSHPRTSFRINERWSSKYDTHKSKMNKIRLEQRTQG